MIFTFAAGNDPGILILFGCMIPFVAIAGITAFAILDLRRQLRDHDVNRGLCKHCGYDLRASPDGRCPECGNTTIRI